jgi:carboxyl-terminal processing protease
MRRIATWRPPLWLVVLLMAGTLVLGSGAGFVRGAEINAGTCTESEEVCAKFTNFWRVWNLAESRFVDPDAVDPDAMIAGAINGMLDSLGDRGHTRYLTAEQNQRFQESLEGTYEGIGAYVDTTGQLPMIVAPIEGSPAEAAGILPGDVILRIDGEPTEGLSIDEVISRIKGPRGTSVTLQIRHAGEETPIDITITRAAVTVPAVTWRMLPGDIAHIRLSQFSDRADAEVRRAVSEAREQGARGLIMDVRDNPGGLRDQATAITGMFLPRDEVVLIEASRDGEQQLYRSRDANPVLDLPMVVLINNGSASSAEIFAGALQDHGRATVIGVPTAGTGTILTPLRLDDGSSLLLGTAQFQTPSGRSLRHNGVAPDITVGLGAGVRPLTPTMARELSDDELLSSPDLQLRRALSVLGVQSRATSALPQVWPR